MKHLLSIEDLTRADLEELLDLAGSFLSVTQRETPPTPDPTAIVRTRSPRFTT